MSVVNNSQETSSSQKDKLYHLNTVTSEVMCKKQMYYYNDFVNREFIDTDRHYYSDTVISECTFRTADVVYNDLMIREHINTDKLFNTEIIDLTMFTI